MSDYEAELEAWKKKAHQKLRDQQVDKAKEERLKKEADWQKTYDDLTRRTYSGVNAETAACYAELRAMRQSQSD